jgi:DNA-directed RNA polymerase subunit F
MDVIEHYLSQMKFEDFPILHEVGISLGTILKPGRKEEFIQRVEDVLNKVKGAEFFDVKKNSLKITDKVLWKKMKQELLGAETKEDLKSWGGSDGDMKKLVGVTPGNVDKGLNGLAGAHGKDAGDPTGADWEHIITDKYNALHGLASDTKASKHAKSFYPTHEEGGENIANNLTSEIGKSGKMTQFGGGKSSGNLSAFWKGHGATDGTPKTDMYTPSYNISLKKKGGSQLMSAAKNETLATFYAALEFMGESPSSQPEIAGIIKKVETGFSKVATDLTKKQLADLAKLPKKDVPDSRREAVDEFVGIEKFHKELNEEIKEDLDPTKTGSFREFFVYEAMSGQKKFTGGLDRARASICVEFDPDSGSVTKFIKTTSDGKSKFGATPKVSGKVKSLAATAKFYSAWKSSDGNPYSSFRINIKEGETTTNIPSLKNIIREVVLNDRLVRAVNKNIIAEGGQLDEGKFWNNTMKFLTKVGAGAKKLGSKIWDGLKIAGEWLVGIYNKIFDHAKKALNKILKLGKDTFKALFGFVGQELSSSSKASLPSDVQLFAGIG